MQFNEKVLKEESTVIAIDFDGVIHSFERGYFNGTIYGTPIKGAKEALEYLSKHYTIIIYTTKARKDRPLIDGKTGTELVWEWLKKYNINQYITDISAEKPRAACYVDDKAIRFTNWEQTIIDIKNEGI